MSQENVETFIRGLDAYNRRDIESLIAEAHSEIEWYAGLVVRLGGEDAVYRGHDGLRKMVLDVDDTLAEIGAEVPEIRDLGDQVLAIGRVRTRGKASGIVTESPLGCLVDFRDGKIFAVRTYLDPTEALEAAELSE